MTVEAVVVAPGAMQVWPDNPVAVPLEAAGTTVSQNGAYTATYDSEDGPVEVSVSARAPSDNTANIGLMIMQVQIKSRNNAVSTIEVSINLQNGKIMSSNAEALEKMLEQAANLGKAKKSGLFAKIAGWVAVVFTAAAAIALGNPVLFAAAVFGASMMIASQTGLTEKIIDAIGMEAYIAIVVLLTVLLVVAAVVVPVASVGLVAATIGSVATIGAGVAGVAAGSSQIVTSVYTHEGQVNEADASRALAEMGFSQDVLDDVLELFRGQMELFEKAIRLAHQLIDENGDLNSHVASVRA